MTLTTMTMYSSQQPLIAGKFIRSLYTNEVWLTSFIGLCSRSLTCRRDDQFIPWSPCSICGRKGTY